MSFSRSTTKRFSERVSCVPPPGHNNPKRREKVASISVEKSNRFKEPKEPPPNSSTFASINASVISSSNASAARKTGSARGLFCSTPQDKNKKFKPPTAKQQSEESSHVKQLEKQMEMLAKEKQNLNENLRKREKEVNQVRQELESALAEKATLLTNVTDMEKQLSELKCSKEIWKNQIQVAGKEYADSQQDTNELQVIKLELEKEQNQKNEIEDKLKTRQSIMITSEALLKNQIESPTKEATNREEMQAQNVSEFELMKEELQVTVGERNALQARVTELQEQIETLTQKQADLQNVLEDKQNECLEQETKLSEAETRECALEDKLSNLQKELTGVKNENTEELIKYKEENDTLTTEIEIVRTGSQIIENNLRKEISDLQDVNKKLQFKVELFFRTQARMEEELYAIRMKLEHNEREHQEAKAEMQSTICCLQKELKQTISEDCDHVEQMEQDLTEAAIKINALDAEVRVRDNELEELQVEVNDLTEQLEEITEENTATMQHLEKTLTQTTENIEKLQNNLHSKEELQAELEEEVVTLKQQLKANKAFEAKFQKCEFQLAEAICKIIALEGKVMKREVVFTSKEAELTEVKELFKKLTEEHGSLLKKCELHSSDTALQIATLKGTVEIKDIIIKELESEASHLEMEYKTLKEEKELSVVALQRIVDETNNQIRTLQQELSSKENLVHDLQNTLVSKENLVTDQQNRLEVIEKQMCELKNEKQLFMLEKTDVETKLQEFDDIKKLVQEKEKIIEQLQEKKGELTELVDIVQEKLIETEKELQEMSDQKVACVEELDTLSQQMTNRDDQTDWKSMYEELHDKVKLFEERLDAYRLDENALQGMNKDAKHELDKLIRQYSELLGNQNQMQKIKYVLKIKEENTSLKQENRSSREEVNKLKKKIKSLEEKMSQQEGRKKFDPVKMSKHDKENSFPQSPLRDTGNKKK